MKVKVLIMLCCLVAVSAPVFAEALNTSPKELFNPIALIPNATYEFPSILEGKAVSHTFVVKNTGTAPLVIYKVQTTCGCTTANYTEQIAPGEAGSVTISFKTWGYGGRNVSKTATVITNSPSSQSIKLQITGPVEEFANINPRFVRLYGAPGEPIQMVVAVTPSAKHPFRILEQPIGNEAHFRCSLKQQDGTYLLTVANKMTSEGDYYDKITLKTDHPVNPEIKIRVYGNISKTLHQKNL